ncbi:MAG: aminotransferase class I/II-fold pyridoxal phosphate-dependent enzyme [Elusimicrobiota bacterium]|jgi:O-acetylhomoserine (thiol)-lyase|nr:aminotransferase class I/II-fold pyridoxal phosphate-dependent enzyme [Elusimicrobiota bacterium]
MTNNKNYRFDTLKIRAGYNPKEHQYATSVPIYQTTSYELGDTKRAERIVGNEELGWIYTRISNPTVDVLEKRVASLDGATGALALSSGMAAITYTILNLTEKGGRILTSPYIYGGSFDGFKIIYPKFNVYFDLSQNITNPEKLEKEIKEDTKAIFVESISNPNGIIIDIENLAKIAHKNGIPLIVDNTFATPYLLNPFRYGADIVIYSVTKSLSGHGNIIAGLILENGKFPWNNGKFPQFEQKYYTLRDKSGIERNYLEVFPEIPFTGKIRMDYLNYFGSALGPFEAYLALIGIETLSERVEKQISNAKKIVEYLRKNTKYVEWINYPSLETSSYYELAQKYFPRGAGSVFTFGFRGNIEQSEKFIDSLKIFSYLANVGDAKSLVVNSPKVTHAELTPEEQKLAGLKPNLIRLSIGLEDADDLIEDLEQAFKNVF